MAINDKISRTIKCDAPECPNEVTIDPQNPEDIAAMPDWVRTFRTVTNGQNTRFGYCSDVCEVKGVTTEQHNVPEPKQVVEADPAQAAALARNVEASKQLRADGKKKLTLK